MPYLKIQSNQSLSAEQNQALLSAASKTVAKALGKAERYVMVALDPAMPMSFAGSDAATVYMELRSIGLSEQQTPAVSAALCTLAQDNMGVAPERVYISFHDAARKMWGWNSATF